MANALDDIEKALRMLKDRGAEMAAFEATLEQISSSLADIVAIMEKPEAPDNPAEEAAEAKMHADAMASAFRPLLAAMPEPKVTVNAPVTVSTGKAGDKWRVECPRADGTTMMMTVTRM